MLTPCETHRLRSDSREFAIVSTGSRLPRAVLSRVLVHAGLVVLVHLLLVSVPHYWSDSIRVDCPASRLVLHSALICYQLTRGSVLIVVEKTVRRNLVSRQVQLIVCRQLSICSVKRVVKFQIDDWLCNLPPIAASRALMLAR